MSVVWSAVCALSTLAAAVQQGSSETQQPQTRTKVLPGHGYIRYEVLPGDEELEPGELIVIHEERRPAPPQEASAQEPAPPAKPREEKACSGPRSKLLARLFEMQGMQIEPELAEWLDRNLTMGNSAAKTIQILGGDPMLLTALKSDGVARGLAEDLARCERAHGT